MGEVIYLIPNFEKKFYATQSLLYIQQVCLYGMLLTFVIYMFYAIQIHNVSDSYAVTAFQM